MTRLTNPNSIEPLRDSARLTPRAILRPVPRPVPLVAIQMDIAVAAGLARVSIRRHYRNGESVPIEAVATLPLPFEAVLTDMEVIVGDRHLNAQAKARQQARQDYEDAIDRGKLAVLHEEKLRGIHVLSVAQLAPGQDIIVHTQLVMPLLMAGQVPMLRFPMTVGHVYGTSPLLPADDLVAEVVLGFEAELTFQSDGELAELADGRLIGRELMRVPLNRALEIKINGAKFGTTVGRDAAGRRVTLTLQPAPFAEGPVDAAILFDKSGSTKTAIGASGSVWTAMRKGLSQSLASLGARDLIALWQFDNEAKYLGKAEGTEAAALVRGISAPSGGTELGKAVQSALRSGAKDILVITDGKTWASEVQAIAATGVRLSAVLVGEDSLDAMIGHLVAMTGGQLFAAFGSDIAPSVMSALAAMRQPLDDKSASSANAGSDHLSLCRGGVAISCAWADQVGAGGPDAIGKYAAALRLARLDEDAATKMAVAHGLCTHLTSLILVDEAEGSVAGLPEMRKVALESFSAQLRTTTPAAAPDRLLDLRPTETSSLAALARAIPWARLGPSLSRGDTSGLSIGQRWKIWQFARNSIVREIASTLQLTPKTVALALLADLMAPFDLNAERLARRVTKNMDSQLLTRARKNIVNELG